MKPCDLRVLVLTSAIDGCALATGEFDVVGAPTGIQPYSCMFYCVSAKAALALRAAAAELGLPDTYLSKVIPVLDWGVWLYEVICVHGDVESVLAVLGLQDFTSADYWDHGRVACLDEMQVTISVTVGG